MPVMYVFNFFIDLFFFYCCQELIEHGRRIGGGVRLETYSRIVILFI